MIMATKAGLGKALNLIIAPGSEAPAHPIHRGLYVGERTWLQRDSRLVARFVMSL
jgi:hypothetical protein